jgi:hypothetical protein
MNWFEQLINLLVVGAIVLTVIKTYLTANKVWSRKHEPVVADSVSVSAQFIGIVTTLPFLVKYAFMDGDAMSFANMSIKLALTLFFLLIGIGFWVGAGTRDGLWLKIKRSLRLERQESMDLINALIRPAGARVILDILRRLAAIDRDLDKREIDFIQKFADRWNIEIDFEREFQQVEEQSTGQMHVELRDRLTDYLRMSPDRDQASQFLDIINSLVEVDHTISDEEEFILAELRGMLEDYISGETSKAVYRVIVVPQDSEERAAVAVLLPDIKPQSIWGGNVYYAGEFHSRPFAEMISEKYQALNLFSTVKRFG